MKGDGKKISVIQIIFIVLILSSVLIIATTPLHEAAHWIMSDIDPYIEPVEFHIFDEKSTQYGDNILSSLLGYVVIKEAYPGAFKDRPPWMNLFQELICIFIQLLITCFFVVKIMKLLANKKQELIL